MERSRQLPLWLAFAGLLPFFSSPSNKKPRPGEPGPGQVVGRNENEIDHRAFLLDVIDISFPQNIIGCDRREIASGFVDGVRVTDVGRKCRRNPMDSQRLVPPASIILV
jgi:hypothetical protein